MSLPGFRKFSDQMYAIPSVPSFSSLYIKHTDKHADFSKSSMFDLLVVSDFLWSFLSSEFSPLRKLAS